MSDILKNKIAIEYYAEKNFDMCWYLSRNWSIVKELVHILHIPYRATVRLQSVNLTMSDVYAIWLEMVFHLQRFAQKPTKTPLAQHLVSTLESRQRVIFNNSAMICNIFLDPRLRSGIIKHGKITTAEDAKNKLKELWRRLVAIKAETICADPVNETHNRTNSLLDSS